MPDRSGGLRWVALLVGLPLIALILVVSADAIPDRLVTEKMYDAIVDGSLSQNSYRLGYTGGKLDGHSECKRMSVGLGAPAGMNVFESAVRSPTLGSCEGAVPKIIGWKQGEGLERSYEYYRYWHGSAVVLRPSVAMLGVSGTRLMIAGALVGVTIAFAVFAARLAGRAATALLMAPMLLTTDYIDLPGALVHAIGMVVAVGSATLMLRYLRPDSSTNTYAAAGFTAGAASLFFADLTNPDAAWALAACSAAIVAIGTERVGHAARHAAAVSAAWIAGFVWLWASKWLIASVVLGFDTVRTNVRDQVEVRLNGEAAGIGNSRFDGLRYAWGEWWNEPLFRLVVPGLIVIAVVLVVRRGDLGSTWQRRILVGAPAAIPFVWHLVMRQHTFIHGWFTYRSFAIAFGIALLALTTRIEPTSPVEAEPVQRRYPLASDAASSSGGTFDDGTITR